MSSFFDEMVKRLRTPGAPPQTEGYRQYVRERQSMGEQVVPYEEWIKTAARTDTPQE